MTSRSNRLRNIKLKTADERDRASERIENGSCQRDDLAEIANGNDGREANRTVKLPNQVLAECFRELEKYVGLASTHDSVDPECVHQLRVWSRRTIAGLRFFSPLLPSSPCRSLQKKISRVRSAAGTARDCDVMLERFRAEVDGKEKEKQSGKHASQQATGASPRELKSIIAALELERENAQLTLVDLIRRIKQNPSFDRKIDKLIDELTRETGAWTPTFYRQWTQCRLLHVTDDFGQALMNQTASLQSLHRFRLQVKKTRYTIELVAELADPVDLKNVLKKCSQLQERLGKINDLAVLIERLKQEYPARRGKERKRSKQVLKSTRNQLCRQFHKIESSVSPAKLKSIKRGIDRLLAVTKN